MASIQPSTGSSLVRDAHTHAIKATETWAAFAKAMQNLATNTAAARARALANEKRSTDYARGILGEHRTTT